jgi:hypothetical protein
MLSFHCFAAAIPAAVVGPEQRHIARPSTAYGQTGLSATNPAHSAASSIFTACACVERPMARQAPKPTGCNWSYLAHRIGPAVPELCSEGGAPASSTPTSQTFPVLAPVHASQPALWAWSSHSDLRSCLGGGGGRTPPTFAFDASSRSRRPKPNTVPTPSTMPRCTDIWTSEKRKSDGAVASTAATLPLAPTVAKNSCADRQMQWRRRSAWLLY